MCFESEEQINTIIHGLKGLYSKLASQGKQHIEARSAAANGDDGEMAAGFDMSGSFDTESDACLMSLKELFLTRVNQNKERRIKQNQANVMMSGLSRVTWLTLIMPFLQLDESLCLGKTCLYFN